MLVVTYDKESRMFYWRIILMNENIMSKDFKSNITKRNYKKGSILQGIVKSIQPYGAFVEVAENVIGLLHIEDISVSRIKHPKDRFKVGNKIKVQVKNYDSNTGRLSLSTKELHGSWEDNIKEFSEKTVVKGIVRNRDKYGVFVELKPNLVGLAEYKSYVSYGDEVNVFIKKISSETKKVKLVIVD